jgi:FADH2 O2-dependent halogenase
MLYFACTIAHEQRRLNKSDAVFFLNADDPKIREMVYSSYEDLLNIISAPVSEEEIKNFTALIKQRIEPFNSAGLLDPSAKNMYRHTVAVL